MEIIGKEVAEAEFLKLAERMDIDTDESDMTAEDLEDFLAIKKKLIKAIMAGRLSIDDDGLAVYDASRSGLPNALKFQQLSGAILMASDRKKAGQDVGKMMAVIDEMTKSAPGTASKLKGVDLGNCMKLATLFLDALS